MKPSYVFTIYKLHLRFIAHQGKTEAIPFIPVYHYRMLPKHLDISQVSNLDSSPLHIV